MSLEDRYVTPTPEGISLDVALAGLGSRFGAIALDTIVQVIVFVVLEVVVVAVTTNDETGSLVRVGAVVAGYVVIYFGYFIACELLFSGRSLGKRAFGIRVVTQSGLAVGFGASLLRNVGRIADWLPFFYGVGFICVLASSKNQRVGDMLAGTIVIRERHAADHLVRGSAHSLSAWTSPVQGLPPLSSGASDALALVDVSAVSDEEISLVHQFLARRSGYTADARARLATNLATRLASRVSGVATADPELFLETVARARALRR